jgi:hypothetical protein
VPGGLSVKINSLAPNQSLDFLSKNPNLPIRGMPIKKIVPGLADNDPQAAAVWVASIQNPEERAAAELLLASVLRVRK